MAVLIGLDSLQSTTENTECPIALAPELLFGPPSAKLLFRVSVGDRMRNGSFAEGVPETEFGNEDDALTVLFRIFCVFRGFVHLLFRRRRALALRVGVWSRPRVLMKTTRSSSCSSSIWSGPKIGMIGL